MIRRTDIEAVRRFTLDHIRRSGNLSGYDRAEEASYLHEFLNSVLQTKPYLWLGEVKQYCSDEDWKTLIKYAISINLGDEGTEPSGGCADPEPYGCRTLAGPSASTSASSPASVSPESKYADRLNRAREDYERMHGGKHVPPARQSAEPSDDHHDDADHHHGKKCIEGLWYD